MLQEPKPKKLSAIKSIRAFCVQCTAGDLEAIRNCSPVPGIEACPLWRYRMGSNPNISDATKQRQRDLAKERGFGAKTAPNDGTT